MSGDVIKAIIKGVPPQFRTPDMWEVSGRTLAAAKPYHAILDVFVQVNLVLDNYAMDTLCDMLEASDMEKADELIAILRHWRTVE